MFSIADLLDRAKARSNIESDYRLSKVLRINQSALSNYRHGRALPGVEMIESLCALSGDDAGLIVAQVEAARAADGPVRTMWLSVARRLAGGAQTAILSVLISISLIASFVQDARSSALSNSSTVILSDIYIVSITILSVLVFLLVRLRQIPVFGILI